MTRNSESMDESKYDEGEHEYYESLFDPLRTERKARRRRRSKVRHVPKRPEDLVIAELGDLAGLEGGFKTTYRPSLHEAEWLLWSLKTFYDQALIVDVMAQIKGGKEANVYRCAAHPSTGVTWLAAKVYRPHKFRVLRNDWIYREGRPILTDSGRPVKTTDHRIMRAIGKKSTFGRQVQHTSWLMYEYTALERLHKTGAAVPQPFASCENAILMGYCGDERMAAPTLNEVRLDKEEATSLFGEMLRNIELMLEHDMIHGDLSAYNVLYWEGEITVIDFPQVTDVRTNNSAYLLLSRDIRRVCEYFIRQGVRCDPSKILEELWDRYVHIDFRQRAMEELELLMASDRQEE